MSRFLNCRKFVALLALASLLFSQLALAAYACPGDAPGATGASAASSLADRPMPNCDGMDMEQSALCQAHSQDGNPPLERAQSPDVPPFIVASFIVAVAIDATPVPPPRPDRSLIARATAPPLAVLHCCFRI